MYTLEKQTNTRNYLLCTLSPLLVNNSYAYCFLETSHIIPHHFTSPPRLTPWCHHTHRYINNFSFFMLLMLWIMYECDYNEWILNKTDLILHSAFNITIFHFPMHVHFPLRNTSEALNAFNALHLDSLFDSGCEKVLKELRISKELERWH